MLFSIKYTIDKYKREKYWFWHNCGTVREKLHFIAESMCLSMFSKLKKNKYNWFDQKCMKYIWSPLEGKLRKKPWHLKIVG